jgi:hypothetical protein
MTMHGIWIGTNSNEFKFKWTEFKFHLSHIQLDWTGLNSIQLIQLKRNEMQIGVPGIENLLIIFIIYK